MMASMKMIARKMSIVMDNVFDLISSPYSFPEALQAVVPKWTESQNPS
jgi:hypothetical protein